MSRGNEGALAPEPRDAEGQYADAEQGCDARLLRADGRSLLVSCADKARFAFF